MNLINICHFRRNPGVNHEIEEIMPKHVLDVKMTNLCYFHRNWGNTCKTDEIEQIRSKSTKSRLKEWNLTYLVIFDEIDHIWSFSTKSRCKPWNWGTNAKTYILDVKMTKLCYFHRIWRNMCKTDEINQNSSRLTKSIRKWWNWSYFVIFDEIQV